MAAEVTGLKGICANQQQTMDYNRRVITVSLECIKTLIAKLDRDGGLGCDGLEYVMSQFSPSEAADSPLGILDSLILYLFHIHRVDWYSRTWRVGSASSLTVREERHCGHGSK